MRPFQSNPENVPLDALQVAAKHATANFHDQNVVNQNIEETARARRARRERKRMQYEPEGYSGYIGSISMKFVPEVDTSH